MSAPVPPPERPRIRPRGPRAAHAAALPYLRLVRAPAVFSALADPLAGVLLVGGATMRGSAPRAAGAAAAMYLAGMALNDLADRTEDARERPERPIPSGAVSPRAAAAIGAALLTGGGVLAREAGAARTGALLAATVLAYDFALKRSPVLGPAAMGACRALSLLVGAEAARGARGVGAALGPALLLGAWVAGLTLVARGETGAARTPELRAGAALAAAALLGAAAREGARTAPWTAAVAALAGPALARALRAPSPATVGPAVGALVRAIPAFDAALVAARRPGAAVALLPLLALARWGRALIPIT